MANQSAILAWRIPWTEEPGGLQSMGSQKSWTQLSLHTCAHTGFSGQVVPRGFPSARSESLLTLPHEQTIQERFLETVQVPFLLKLSMVLASISQQILSSTLLCFPLPPHLLLCVLIRLYRSDFHSRKAVPSALWAYLIR